MEVTLLFHTAALIIFMFPF